ncbi:MAG TPA: hypothetical protein VMN60_13950 [Longimicrobiales bacterium]|nr:hypothetical protein [Longimicrobiales bacterium]
MSRQNPFGDDAPIGSQRSNPFGDGGEPTSTEESIARIEHAARTVRRLKDRLGAEGLTLSATRELIDELSKALDATARVMRDVTERERGA